LIFRPKSTEVIDLPNGETMTDTTTPAPAPSVWAGWKTFLFNGGCVVALAAVGYLETSGKDVVPVAYWPMVAMIIPMVNVWLRSQTSTTMFKKV
jgi:hypothetical protein